MRFSLTPPPIFVFAASFLASASLTLADTFTWRGNNGDNFRNKANWTQASGSGDIPGSSDLAIFPTGLASGTFRIDLRSGNNQDRTRTADRVEFRSAGTRVPDWEFYGGTFAFNADGANDVYWEDSTETDLILNGNFALSGTGALDLIGGANGRQSLRFVGPLSGSGTINFDSTSHGGDDVVVFDVPCPFTGQFNVPAGQITLTVADALPNAVLDFSTSKGNLLVAEGSQTLEIQNLRGTAQIEEDASLMIKTPGGDFRRFIGDGELTFTDSNPSAPGTINITGTSALTNKVTFNNTTTTWTASNGFPEAIVELTSGHTSTTTNSLLVGGLIGGGTLNLGIRDLTIGATSDGTIGRNFSGRLIGSGEIRLNGGSANIHTFSSASSDFTGSVLLNAGEVVVGSNTFANAIVTVQGNTVLTLPNSQTTTFGSLDSVRGLALNSNLVIGSRNQAMKIAGPLTGTGQLTKVGTGTLTLEDDITSTGKVTISEGAFTVDQETAIAGPLDVDAAVLFAVTGNSTNQINVAGPLDVQGGTLQLSISGQQDAGVIELMTYGSLTGTFATVGQLPPGYELDYSHNGNTIALVDGRGPGVITASGDDTGNVPFFDITFNEPVAGLDPADFVFEGAGFSGNPTFSLTSLGGNQVRVSVVGLVGSGDLELKFAPDADFTDAFGNAFTDLGGSLGVILSDYTNAAPTVTFTPALGQGSPTNDPIVRLIASFSEPVTGPLAALAVSDFTFSILNDLSITSTSLTPVANSTNEYLLTIEVSGAGRVFASLPAGNVIDAAGAINLVTVDSFGIGVDLIPPVMLSNTPRTRYTNGESVVFDVTFNGLVGNFTGASIIKNADLSHDPVVLDGSGRNFTVTVSGFSGEGVFELDFATDEIIDDLGNVVTEVLSSTTVRVDMTKPVITLNGAADIALDAGETWTDPGTVLTEDYPSLDGVIVAGDTVDTATPGTYIISYNSTDLAGNDADEVTRTVVVRNAFESWSNNYGLSGNDALLTADPDGDGRTNLEEFAFDGDPTNPTSSGKTRLSIRRFSGVNHLNLDIAIRSGAVITGNPFSATVDGITYTALGDDDLSGTDLTVRRYFPVSSGLPTLSEGYEYFTLGPATAYEENDSAFIWMKVEVTE